VLHYGEGPDESQTRPAQVLTASTSGSSAMVALVVATAGVLPLLLATAGQASGLTFEAPQSVLHNSLPEHADHFFTIPASQEPVLAGSVRLAFGSVLTPNHTASVAVSRDGVSWSLEHGAPPPVGQLFPTNDSCLHTLGAVQDGTGPAALHGTFPPTRGFSSDYVDTYCAGAVDGRVTRTREQRPVRFRGLPVNVIRMTTAETGWARLPSGRIIHTPYVHVSDHDLLHQPASAFACCLNYTCPCGRMVGSVCQCPPRTPAPCTHYGPGVPPPAGHSPVGLCRNFSVVAFASDDGGFTFDFLSVVASNQQWPQFEEGPNENAMVALPSGDLLSIIRIEGGDGLPHMQHKPLLCARSATSGRSWSASLMRTDIRSARPRLLRLGSTLLLLAIRPSLSLWTSETDGNTWSTGINLAAAHNAALPPGAASDQLRFCSEFGWWNHTYMPNGTIYQDQWMQTGYSSLVRVGESTAMVCYVR
jgi:hypothetical protein